MKGQPDPHWYAYKKQCLAELESLSGQGSIDLFYGDESAVCSEGYVPYGWQFPGEQVCIRAEKGFRINCFGLISRQSQCYWATTDSVIDSQFIQQQLEELSWKIRKETVVVLDCARIHTAQQVQQRMPFWQQRGLFIFLLPPYSPHLNLAETLWRKLKSEWLLAEDYVEKQALAYATNRCLANVGSHLTIKFSPFNLN